MNDNQLDISNYSEKIAAQEDHILFEDAVTIGRMGKYRAAYIMIWLSCAESLKRRFREASKWDHHAGQIFSDIESKESSHMAVDRLVLDRAKEYGFISDLDYENLKYIYQMRCVYGHPYEEAPLKENVVNAAAIVVNSVLSKSVKLRHGYGESILKKLLENSNFLDDQESAVEIFANQFILRFDNQLYGWLLDKYWKKLEEISDDESMAMFIRRGVWFSCAVINNVGASIFSYEEWHSKLSNFPKILMQVCAIENIFKNIGESAQNMLVGIIIEESMRKASVLSYLEELSMNNLLTERQEDRLNKRVLSLSSDEIRGARLKLKTCYYNVITKLKSYNWYIQNPVVDLIMLNGEREIADLSVEQQVELGRNILQTCDGGSKTACEFLKNIVKNNSSWPFDFLRGIVLETFNNERSQIRIKKNNFNDVICIICNLSVEQRNRLLGEIVRSIDVGVLNDPWMNEQNFNKVINILEGFEWAEALSGKLKDKYNAKFH